METRGHGGGGALVIELDRGYGGGPPAWLASAGASAATLRAHAGDPLPADPAGYGGLVLLGVGSAPAASPRASALVAAALAAGTPLLAVGLGARLLATAAGGEVGPAAAGPAAGPGLLARRDAAGFDPLFAQVPFTPDVFHWHHEEVTVLPPGGVLLASATRYPHQAFRVGRAAWGLHFHPAPDPDEVALWPPVAGPPAELAVAAREAAADLTEVWRPVVDRFVAVMRGERDPAPRPELPLRPR